MIENHDHSKLKPQMVTNWIKRLPNNLTLARLLIIPILLLIYPFDVFFLRVICALVFAAAALTDFVDGYVARKYEATSVFGALLDPMADKLLSAAGLVLVTNAGHLWAFLAATLICRELLIAGVRLVALEQNLRIEVNQFGKVKTAFQFAGIFCLMINEPLFNIPFRAIGMICIWLALGFSVYSAYLYCHEFWQLRKKELE